MPAIQLVSYSIRITDRNSATPLPLNNFYSGTDLFTIMERIFGFLRQGLIKDPDALTSFGINLFNVTTQRYISGIVKSGDYGIEVDLVNIDTNEVKYRRKIDETEPRPFYFLVYVPQSGTTGILLLERNGMFGIKTVFSNYFFKYFIDNYPNVLLTIDILTPSALIDKVLTDGRFTEVEFIKESIPNNYEDVIANSGGNFITRGKFKQTISAPPGGFIGSVADRIRDILKDRRTVKTMYEIPDQYDNVKVRVDIDGHYRTMNISRLDRFRPNFDVTDEIEIGSDGNPTFESMNLAAQPLLDMIKGNLGLDK